MKPVSRQNAGRVLLFILIATGAIPGCAYFNLLYNARHTYEKASSIPPARDGKPTRQQIELYNDVIKKCEALVTNYPKSKWVDDAILLMGKSLYMQMEYDKAIVKFKELEELFPDSRLNEEGQIYLARSYLGKGKIDQALPVLRRFTGKYEKSRYMDEALFLLGTNQMKMDDAKPSMATLGTLAKKYPHSKYRIQADVELAGILMEKGEYEASLDIYRRLVNEKLDVEVLNECLARMSEAYLEVHDYRRALEAADRIGGGELKPVEKAGKMLLKAKAYAGLDSTARAIDVYKSLAARFPKSMFSAEAYYRLGMLYQERLDSLVLAKKQFENVPKQYPKSPFAKDAIKRSSNISNLLKFSRNLGTGSEEKKADAQFKLAEIQLTQFDNAEKALEEYKKFLQQFGSSELAPKAAYSIGYIYSTVLGDSVKAAEAFEYLVEHYPDSQQAEYARRFLAKKGLEDEEKGD